MNGMKKKTGTQIELANKLCAHFNNETKRNEWKDCRWRTHVVCKIQKLCATAIPLPRQRIETCTFPGTTSARAPPTKLKGKRKEGTVRTPFTLTWNIKFYGAVNLYSLCCIVACEYVKPKETARRIESEKKKKKKKRRRRRREGGGEEK